MKITRKDVEARLAAAKADAEQLRKKMVGFESHAYFIPMYAAVQAAEARVDALTLALAAA